MTKENFYPTIKIVPLSQCLAHEGVVQKWVEGIAFNILDNGIMKNPIIVTKRDEYYVVIDGMHRFAACKEVEIRDILVCEIDYFSDDIVLEGWDAFTFETLDLSTLLKTLFPTTDYTISQVTALSDCQTRVNARTALVGGTDRRGSTWIVEKKSGAIASVDELIRATELIDQAIDEKGLKVAYIANSISIEEFNRSGAESIVVRPVFTKNEIIERTLQNKLFPRKSTKHVVPNRPLRVDIDLALLRADIDIETKNRVLQEHLQWCFKSDRVRYYPEPIFIFSD